MNSAPESKPALWRRLAALGVCVMFATAGCGFHGLNSLALPGVVGRGSGATVYHVQIANVGTLESNSPVMINDVIVGSVGDMTVQNWHADVEVSVKPGVVVAGNAVATIGQTSLLGSQHVDLNPPTGVPPTGRLESGATIPLSRSSSYPSTEQTLSALSAMVNAGGLGQLGDIVHNFNAALSGRQDTARDLLGRLDTFVGTFDEQRDDFVSLINELNRVAATFAGQRDIIKRALRTIPPALDVLNSEEPRVTAALDKLGTFATTATQLVHDSQADLVKDLQNLAPTIQALADVGPDLDTALAYATVFPYGQNLLDRGVRGDYFNLYFIIDLTVARLKRGLLLGTHWGQEGMELTPAPGDPGYDQYYTKHPLSIGVAPPPPQPDQDCVLSFWICSYPAQGAGPVGHPDAASTPAPASPGMASVPGQGGG